MTSFRRIFLVLYTAVFMSSLGLGILSPILPAYVDHFAASSFVLGIVFGVYPAARALFMPPVGILSDRLGRRPFILFGLAMFTAVSPLYAMADSVYQLMLVRFLQGMAAAMLMPVAMSAIGDLSPRGREGFIMGSFTSAFFAGLGFGPLIGGFLRDRYSMAAAFYGMGALSLASLVFTFFALPARGPQPDPEGEGKGKDVSGAVERIEGLVHDVPLLGLLFFRFTRALGIGLVWVIMPLYAVTSLGISAFHVGILLSANTFITTFLQSPAGHLSDRIGHHRTLSGGSLLASVAVIYTGWATGFGGLLVAAVLLGTAGALIVPAGSAMAVGLGRSRGMGRTMGLYNASLSFGTMLGPVLGGALLDLTSVRIVFAAGGLIGIAGWLVLLATAPGEEAAGARFL